MLGLSHRLMVDVVGIRKIAAVDGRMAVVPRWLDSRCAVVM